MKVLELRGVTYRYRAYESGENGVYPELPAVEDISLGIEGGEFVALIGHNGSGKSTLAKLFNGLYTPAEGTVTALGLTTDKPENLFEIRKNVGVVFQNPDNQMVATIVEDDVAFGPENIGLAPGEIGRRIDFALSAVGMENHRSSTASRLSGGQKQRIAIAGVLAVMPKVLVLDESTAMLDPRGRREVMDVIKDLNKKHGMTVVLITHFMNEAAEADRVIALSGGKIALDGTPKEVFSEAERLAEIGLEVPVPARLRALLLSEGISLPEGILTEGELSEALCRLK